MKSKFKNVYNNEGNLCKKCGSKCLIVKHRIIPSNNLFYYSQWEECSQCNTTWFDPKYRTEIINQNVSLFS